MNHPPSRPRAFALLELMFVLGLLAFVSLVAGQIFIGVTRTTAQVNERQTAQVRVDQAIHSLRRDVWNAQQVTLTDPTHLQIKLDDTTIAWTTGQFLKRASGSATQEWNDLQSDLRFEVQGPTVSLVQDPSRSETGGRITLLNANSLLKGPAR